MPPPLKVEAKDTFALEQTVEDACPYGVYVLSANTIRLRRGKNLGKPKFTVGVGAFDDPKNNLSARDF